MLSSIAYQAGLWALLLAPASLAETASVTEPGEQRPAERGGLGELAEERSSVTEHVLTIDGAPVRYRATAGTMILRQDDGTAKGSIFYVSYEALDAPDPGERPLSFAFNGGPGSSSVWLHLGLLGPRRVLMDREGQPLPPPFELVDNPHSVLDMSDLVMIDPVTTGFSRAAPGEEASEFHGLHEAYLAKMRDDLVAFYAQATPDL